MFGHKWTGYEVAIIIKMWCRDEPLDKISKRLNVSTYALLKQIQRMRKNGIPLEKRNKGNKNGIIVKPWSKKEIKYLIKHRNDGDTSSQIGSALRRTPNAVDGMIAKLRSEGIDISKRGQGSTKLYSVKEMKNTFNKYKKPEVTLPKVKGEVKNQDDEWMNFYPLLISGI